MTQESEPFARVSLRLHKAGDVVIPFAHLELPKPSEALGSGMCSMVLNWLRHGRPIRIPTEAEMTSQAWLTSVALCAIGLAMEAGGIKDSVFLEASHVLMGAAMALKQFGDAAALNATIIQEMMT